MPLAELAHLELLAEVDALVAELNHWGSRAPDWPAARQSQSLVRRLTERVGTLRLRWEAPLVVATMGGTGTGKSSLVNALVGSDVTAAGRQRPTTTRPILVCRPDISPEALGIPAESVHVVHRDLPALRDLVIVDCPDPDTSEDAETASSNLARLRELLPHCDVLLVTTTQQKYNSARVAAEMYAAAAGARLVFVQTHADTGDDIRDDWRRLLSSRYAVGEMFLVDSIAALADARAGRPASGDFARLLQLLTHELAGTAGHRIRRANFLDLVEQTLAACRVRLDAGMPAVKQLEAGLNDQRSRLSARLAGQMRDELLGSRRPWENRLIGEIASRWGFSPFACLLRAFQGIGGLIASASLFRVRTPAQLALWGAMEGTRRFRVAREERQADDATNRAVAFSWDEGELRTAAIIVEGYANEAQLPRDLASLQTIEHEAAVAGTTFVQQAAVELQSLVRRLADRHTGWFTRLRYELLLCLMLGVLLYRFGRNFFYDSWLAAELGFSPIREPMLGTDFFLGAGFVLLLWSALLLWFFSMRLRRGLTNEVNELSLRWTGPAITSNVFSKLEHQCRVLHAYRDELERLQNRVSELQQRLALPEPALGHLTSPR